MINAGRSIAPRVKWRPKTDNVSEKGKIHAPIAICSLTGIHQASPARHRAVEVARIATNLSRFRKMYSPTERRPGNRIQTKGAFILSPPGLGLSTDMPPPMPIPGKHPPVNPLPMPSFLTLRIESSALVTGLLAGVSLGLALVGAYQLTV